MIDFGPDFVAQTQKYSDDMMKLQHVLITHTHYDHLSSFALCQFAGSTGITHNIPDNSVCAGFPAQPYKEWLKQEASLRKVGDLLKKVKELEKALAELKK